MAGALERRVVGPIWFKGVQVTDIWVGDIADPTLKEAGDVTRAVTAVVATSAAIVVTSSAILLLR